MIIALNLLKFIKQGMKQYQYSLFTRILLYRKQIYSILSNIYSQITRILSYIQQLFNKYLMQHIVGKYRVMEVLGQGAFATVYRGENIENKKIVALKKMKKLNKNDIEMIKKEIDIMKQLRHKNIVQYETDFRHTNGDWYIVLQFCGKGDMEHYKEKVGRIPEHHCKLFVKGILQALVEIHKKNIAHRDLKLANILITDQYQLKLGDFGFSKDLEAGWTKTFCGTLLTMAPQILKRQKYNQKCDVWSLGIITFIMLYNRAPYYPNHIDGQGIQGITNAVTNRTHKYDPQVSVSDLGKKFIDLCLQKEISKRPFSQDLLAHDWLKIPLQLQYPLNSTSKLRVQAMQGSFQQKPEVKAQKLCNIMLNEVIEVHLKQMWDIKLFSTKKINEIVRVFKSSYPDNSDILKHYLLLAVSKIEESFNKELILILKDKSCKLQAKKIKKFQQFVQKSLVTINQELKQLGSKKPQNVNIHKEIVKFAMNESEILMQSGNEEQIKEKLSFLKNLLKFTLDQYENSIINVKWGQRDDLQELSIYIEQILNDLTEEQILKILSQDLTSQQDLQSIWLIENTIKEINKERKGIQFQLGKLALFILNISSNFTVDKTMQTDVIQMNQESLLITS